MSQPPTIRAGDVVVIEHEGVGIVVWMVEAPDNWVPIIMPGYWGRGDYWTWDRWLYVARRWCREGRPDSWFRRMEVNGRLVYAGEGHDDEPTAPDPEKQGNNA